MQSNNEREGGLKEHYVVGRGGDIIVEPTKNCPIRLFSTPN